MRALHLAPCFLALLAPSLQAQEAPRPKGIDRERLKKAVLLPTIQLRVPLQLSVDDIKELRVPPSSVEDIATLQEALRKAPGELEKRCRLVELLGEAKRTAEAKEQALEYVRILKSKVAAAPADPSLLVKLGVALQYLEDPDEGERLLRKATGMPSPGWEAWSCLGKALLVKAMVILAPPAGPGESSDADTLMERILGRKEPASADAVERALRCLDEGRAAEDCGVVEAPEDAGPVMERCWFTTISFMLRLSCGEETGDPTRGFRESLPDAKRIAALMPENPRPLTYIVLVEIVAGLGKAKPGVESFTKESFDALPEESRTSIKRCMKSVEGLAGATDPVTSATASGSLALMRLLVGDHEGAEAAARREFALQPGDGRYAELLLAFLADNGRLDEMVKTCTESLAARDSAKIRLVRAKAYDKLGKKDESAADAVKALKLDPDGFETNLYSVALALRRAGDPYDSELATRLLAKAAEAEKQDPNPDRTQALRVDTGIHLAFMGRLEEAASLLRQAADEGDCPQAAEALAAMGR